MLKNTTARLEGLVIKRDSLTLQIRDAGDKAIVANKQTMQDLNQQVNSLRTENTDIQKIMDNL